MHWCMYVVEASAPGDIDLWPRKSIGFQTLIRTKYVPRLVKIHWRIMILECSQGLYAVKICPGDLDLWPWKSIDNFHTWGLCWSPWFLFFNCIYPLFSFFFRKRWNSMQWYIFCFVLSLCTSNSEFPNLQWGQFISFYICNFQERHMQVVVYILFLIWMDE
jgi:hypothetical protein